jgi:hypothetical protein
VRTYTAHIRADRKLVLVKEAFSWGAFLFGPLWLLAQRAWIAAIASLVVFALPFAVRSSLRGVLVFALLLLLGLIGRDLVRWSLGRRGYALSHVVAGRSPDDAYLRLLDQVPELTQTRLIPA